MDRNMIFKNLVMELMGYVEGSPSTISRDFKQAYRSGRVDRYLKAKAGMTDEEVVDFKNKYKELLEG